MAGKKPQRGEASLHLDPEVLLSFIATTVFERAWERCGLTDDDLFELQQCIIARPKAAPVIVGTGGLRKLRFSPAGAAQGKSGSHRICYVYYEEFGIILLLTAYAKNKKDDLSPASRNAMRKMIEAQHRLLRRGPIP